MNIRTKLILLLFAAAVSVGSLKAQTAGTPTESTTYMVRESVFGKMVPLPDVRLYSFGANDLAVIQNGYVITVEEFRYSFYQIDRSDTSLYAKKTFLDTYISSTQRMAEAMAQNLDTTTQFKLEFLKYKQALITKYLNEGKTRAEAEALPEVKYDLRAHYRGMLIFELMLKEVWSQGTESNLQSYYNNHLAQYQGQPYDISRTKVVYDFNKEKETALDARANEKFPVMKNTSAIGKL